ncbi:uncharacterized protein LOC134776609 isoform X2 [Penaeus indicus]|uniref:uncharacterized protein LOC134776609 isoform X2 n=1 Tax=Penaeus indicus TaxID=29960 RepID=UPI00300C25D3
MTLVAFSALLRWRVENTAWRIFSCSTGAMLKLHQQDADPNCRRSSRDDQRCHLREVLRGREATKTAPPANSVDGGFVWQLSGVQDWQPLGDRFHYHLVSVPSPDECRGLRQLASGVKPCQIMMRGNPQTILDRSGPMIKTTATVAMAQ